MALRAQHIPGVERPPLWRRRWFLETVTSVPPVVAAGFTAVNLWGNPLRMPLGYLAAGMVAWLACAGLLRVALARRQDAKEGPDVTHEGLYAATAALHAAVLHQVGQARGEIPDLRATFHRIVPPLDQPTQIEQIIPYVGATGGLGRRFSLNTGITGQAVRKREPYVMSSEAESEADHRAELVSDWGYTEAQVAQITPGRYSAAAVPVLDKSGQHVLGVIYLDSSAKGIFDPAEATDLLLSVSDAIGEFVTRRY
jgi:hypothetical protein